MNKPMSAAAYRQHAAKVKETAPTEIVTLASGSVFELRKPDLQGYVITGRLPQSLLNAGLEAWKKQGKIPAGTDGKALNVELENPNDAMIFMREMVHEACVNPKFVEFATKDDELGAADMLPKDFYEIYMWAMSGQEVKGPDGLQTFRGGSERRTVVGGINRKKQRRPRKQPVTA